MDLAGKFFVVKNTGAEKYLRPGAYSCFTALRITSQHRWGRGEEGSIVSVK